MSKEGDIKRKTIGFIYMLKEITVLIGALLFGTFCAYLTNYEKNIYLNYFRYLIPLSALMSLIFYKIDPKYSLLFLTFAILLISWQFSTKLFNKKK